MPGGYRKVSDLPVLIPVFPLDGALLLPGCQLPLHIFEPRYLNMIDDAMSGARIIGMIQTAGPGDRARPTLASVGCAGRVTAYAETGDGRYMITLTGVCRFAADLEPEHDISFDRATFLGLLRRYLDHKGLSVEWDAAKQAPARALINSLAMGLPLDPPEKQALLEAGDMAERARVLATLLEIDAAGDTTGDDDEPPPLQ